MRLENTSNQGKWRTIEGRPRCLQRTITKHVWATRIILRASLRCKVAENRHRLSALIDRYSSSPRTILFEKYAGRLSNLKYPSSHTDRLMRKCFRSLGVVRVCCRLQLNLSVCVGCYVSVWHMPTARFTFSRVSFARFCEFFIILYSDLSKNFYSNHLFLN